MSIDNDTIVNEIHTLHADLASWLGAPENLDGLERFVTQQHPDFSMVTLDGIVLARGQLTQALRGAGNSTPGLTIEITGIEILHQSTDSAMVRFQESHRSGGGARQRLTTALLLSDPQARNGLRWRTVHETASPA
ncbi:hypothetical protein HLB23_00915 [Nocardia uniformis]|uniref:DUF4440 domain-containing protein n=1 Tax=Nocardia uniformis TaxID=53432 RepID=A0A849BXP5_9NOCA|nr:hypothetical protein [Nocardia uniformis]NNH68457.1 hypothetical protein [Nocardia uniformis]